MQVRRTIRKVALPALRVPGGASLTRKQIDEYGNFVKIYGAKGLAYIKVNERAKGLEGINSPVAKFLNAEIIEAILIVLPRKMAI